MAISALTTASTRRPRGWDAKRRLAVNGHNDVCLHDAKGRALFFSSQSLNDSLERAIPAAAEVRRVHGKEPFTLVFDLGGYSGETFRILQAEGIGFFYLLKGRGAKRRYAVHQFKAGWFVLEGKRRTWQLLQKKTRVRGVGLIRTVFFVGDDGQRVPVLTNLAAAANPAKVAHCLR